MWGWLRYVGAAGALLGSLPALGQQDLNVIRQARDAFGERIGDESIGLYSESQVRGFDMGNTGAYRIDGAYFTREFPMPDLVLNSVSVNVGINAARMHYPSPSGVVDYRLRKPAPGENTLTVFTGIRDFTMPFLQVWRAYAPKDRGAGIGIGLELTPREKTGYGRTGRTGSFAAIPVWRNEKLRMHGLVNFEITQFNGSTNVTSTDTVLPPKPPAGFNYGVPWGDARRHSANAGMLLDADIGEKWALNAAAFVTDYERDVLDSTVLTYRPGAIVNGTFVRTNFLRGRSLLAEAMLSRRFDGTKAVHTVTAGARARNSRAVTKTATPINFTFTQPGYVFPADPGELPTTNRVASTVHQLIGSVEYAGNYYDKVELRGGTHFVQYEKIASLGLGSVASRTERTLAYNASVVVKFSPRLNVFANTVKGIEESGIAPISAVNRNEILPPVSATEYETGLYFRIRPGLNISGALFQVTKLTNALRPDGIFGLVGQVRHRGGELSFTGQLGERTSVVIGGVLMAPRLSGELVDRGLVAARPVGVSRASAVFSFDHRLAFIRGLSVDGRLTLQSARPENSANSLFDKGMASLALGLRYATTWREYPFTFRVLASNIGTARPWVSGLSGILTPQAPTSLRATVRATF